MDKFSLAQAHTATTQERLISLEETALPTGLVLGGGFTLLITLLAAALWVGKMAEKLKRQEEEMDDLTYKIESIQKLLEGLDSKIEASHREFKRELLEEIKKEGIRTEGNIESYFNGALIEQRLLNEQFKKAFDERNQTISQIKHALNRIGNDAREAKAQARLVWEMNRPPDNPPSRPGNYRV